VGAIACRVRGEEARFGDPGAATVDDMNSWVAVVLVCLEAPAFVAAARAAASAPALRVPPLVARLAGSTALVVCKAAGPLSARAKAEEGAA
jgi:hypothetical protein